MPSLCPVLIIHLDGFMQGWCGRTQWKSLHVCKDWMLPEVERLLNGAFLMNCQSVFLPAWLDLWRSLLALKIFETRSLNTNVLIIPHCLGMCLSLYVKLVWLPDDQIFIIEGRSWNGVTTFFVISVQVGFQTRQCQEVWEENWVRCSHARRPVFTACHSLVAMCWAVHRGTETWLWRVLSSLDRWKLGPTHSRSPEHSC